MVEQALVVVEAEQQRPDLALSLGIAEAADHAVGGAQPLDLEHRRARRADRRRRAAWRRRRRAPPPRAASQACASRGRGVQATGSRPGARRRGVEASRALARRSTSGAPIRRAPPAPEQVEQDQLAGVSRASLRIRLSAGCRRICRASKESAPPTGMTSSPSSTNAALGSCAQRRHDLGEIAAERLARLGPSSTVVAVAEGEAAEAVPFRLVLPALASGQRSTSFASIGAKSGFTPNG